MRNNKPLLPRKSRQAWVSSIIYVCYPQEEKIVMKPLCESDSRYAIGTTHASAQRCSAFISTQIKTNVMLPHLATLRPSRNSVPILESFQLHPSVLPPSSWEESVIFCITRFSAQNIHPHHIRLSTSEGDETLELELSTLADGVDGRWWGGGIWWWHGRGHPNEMPIWQGHIAAAEAHYCQMCFVFSRGGRFCRQWLLPFSLSLSLSLVTPSSRVAHPLQLSLWPLVHPSTYCQSQRLLSLLEEGYISGIFSNDEEVSESHTVEMSNPFLHNKSLIRFWMN